MLPKPMPARLAASSTAVLRPAIRNAARRVGSSGPRRNGCSTKRHDTYEIATVSANSASLSKDPSVKLLFEKRAKVNSGQCHRYREYEMRPKKRTISSGEKRLREREGTP